MTERTKAFLQIKRSYAAMLAANKHLQNVKLKPEIMQGVSLLTGLISKILTYAIQKIQDSPEPVEDNGGKWFVVDHTATIYHVAHSRDECVQWYQEPINAKTIDFIETDNGKMEIIPESGLQTLLIW